MALTIPTKALVGLLTDLAHTAADPAEAEATAAVLLHSARGHVGGDPGKTDLFVGTSTDSTLLGHAHTPCYGSVAPMLWPIGEVKAVLAVLKPLAKIKEHTTEIALDAQVVTVAETKTLFGGLEVSFKGFAVEDWPTEGVHRLLTVLRTTPGERHPDDPAPRTDIHASRLAPFLKIASRRGEPLRLFRWHQHVPIVIEIGSAYRGITRPSDWPETDSVEDGFEPSGEVYPLVLDDADA